MKTLYLAKEPGTGVRSDLSRLSGEVTVVDCLNAYGDFYRKMGYNVISKTKYFELDGTMRFDVVIGNPPYGSGGNDAIKFLNKAADLSDDVRMILPLSVRKISSLNKIRLDIECVVDEQLPDDTFPGSIRTVKQRWVKTNTPREKIPTTTKHSDFQFIPYKRRHEANMMIGRIGGGPAGRVKTEDFTHYCDTHYFIKASPQVVKNLVSLADEFREIALRETNGRPSLTKNDIVELYTERFCNEEE
tara:strand:- start:430 stop:1164 length:735 start_codon:yes stop_codon:yes gene_type:complete